MAIWQISFYAVERNKTIQDEDICYWEKEPANARSIVFLTQCESWSNDIIQYGNDQSTCIELFLEEQRVVEIEIRLDLRSITYLILNDVLNYITNLDALIYYENSLIEPTITNFKSLIVRSAAYKFCNNPLKFIDEINGSDIC